MIENLNEKKLVEYGFEKENIERLLNWDNYELTRYITGGFLFASNIEGKIYSGLDAARKIYFQRGSISFPIYETGLIVEYYKLSLEVFLEAQKKLLGSIFNFQTEKENFKQKQIEWVNDCIEYKTPLAKRFNGGHLKDLNIYKGYLSWLNNLNEDVLTDEIKPKKEIEKKLIEFKNEFNYVNETTTQNRRLSRR